MSGSRTSSTGSPTTSGGFFDAISNVIGSAVDGLINVLQAPDPVVLAVIFALLGLWCRGWRFAVVALLGLLLIISMEQWEAAMQTLALVLVATVVAVAHRDPAGRARGTKRAGEAVRANRSWT